MQGKVRREEVNERRPRRAGHAATALLRHWRSCSDQEVAAALRVARESVAAFSASTRASGSLLQSWIRGHDVVQYEHYPASDVVDRRRGFQFYYHAHRDGDLEHGHLHLFCHATSGGRRRYLRNGRRAWARTSPSHLIAISLDARGLPVGLFTVNRWVTGGHWFDAATTMQFAERFVVQGMRRDVHSTRWINAFVEFYRPLVKELLVLRDRRLARRAHLARALDDQSLEVLSRQRLDWAADLDAIEIEAARRRI